ncbi:MFS general substrate transporter [Lentinula aciculospora]|uniref:MFS general substrate transporter n=1 Tax=Lentinula aciculospora TaxID=153920 RepID=A0A9W9DL90_9AGAR|nr:MFS general substrate transporter [Lentinula aciculospora]
MTGSSSSDLEKDSIRVNENANVTTTPLYNEHVDISGVDERKLLRKIDIALIPWLSLLYLLSFLDRTSIGNAKVPLATELRRSRVLFEISLALSSRAGPEHYWVSDTQYLLALTIFFFSYAIFEVPSNVFLKRLRPSLWLSGLMFCWGIMMTVQGLVHNFGGLMGMRWMLGLFEAGLFPGVNYYLSCWYKRSEFGIRAAIFFSAATVSGAFGGLLAAAISNMDGVGGKPAWAWIFILEGLATVIAGALSFFIIQDFPDTAKFLTEAERTVVVRRLQGDDQFSAAGEQLRMKYIFKSILDWKTWIGMIVYVGADMPLYAFSLFLPSIISQYSSISAARFDVLLCNVEVCSHRAIQGFKATPANLLTVPVYAFACLITCIVGFLADRWGRRGYFNLIFLCLGAAGYIILIASRNAALSYFAVYLATCGIYPVIPNSIAWVSNNVEGSYKRSVTLAMVISFGNINGAVSSNVYRAKDQPWYPLGHGLVLLYIGFGLISSTTFLLLLKRENAKRDRGERNEIIGDEKSTGHEVNGRYNTVADAKRDKGDEWSGYRYTT